MRRGKRSVPFRAVIRSARPKSLNKQADERHERGKNETTILCVVRGFSCRFAVGHCRIDGLSSLHRADSVRMERGYDQKDEFDLQWSTAIPTVAGWWQTCWQNRQPEFIFLTVAYGRFSYVTIVDSYRHDVAYSEDRQWRGPFE